MAASALAGAADVTAASTVKASKCFAANGNTSVGDVDVATYVSSFFALALLVNVAGIHNCQ